MRSVPTLFSPLIANIALDGIGKYIDGLTVRIKQTGTFKKGKKAGKPYMTYQIKVPYGFIRYADDFLITAPNAELIGEILPHIQTLLKIRGLELNLEKTKFVHIEQGFNYLGFHIRQYKGKTIIEPEKEKVLNKIREIRAWLKANSNASPEAVINYLNPIIGGFAQYYRTVCSKDALSYLDSEIWKSLYRWAKRRHPNKGRKEIAKMYFNVSKKHAHLNEWDFIAKVKDRKGKEKILFLTKASSVQIVRHVKVAGTNSPDDPNLKQYWEKRATHSGKHRFAKGSYNAKVAEQQRHKCPICGDTLYNGEPLNLHHIKPVHKGGGDELSNVVWLHKACHEISHCRKSNKEEENSIPTDD